MKWTKFENHFFSVLWQRNSDKRDNKNTTCELGYNEGRQKTREKCVDFPSRILICWLMTAFPLCFFINKYESWQ